MKNKILVVVCAVAVLAAVTFAGQAGTSPMNETAIVPLPASLSEFYPPQSPAPVFMLSMLDLAKPFSGMVSDVLDGDMPNAQANFKAFKDSYQKVAGMVPEWQGKYPMNPVNQLETALASGDPSQIMPAVDEVGKLCHQCHLMTMGPVQQKYRWDRFGDIVVTDPLSGQEVGFAKLMLMMQTNFAGIGANLGQDQREQALKQLAGFTARFQTMADACMICHDSDRKYYVDETITSMISSLHTELERPDGSMRVVGPLLDSIGKESCSKCHLVHIPAAYSQQAGENVTH